MLQTQGALHVLMSTLVSLVLVSSRLLSIFVFVFQITPVGAFLPVGPLLSLIPSSFLFGPSSPNLLISLSHLSALLSASFSHVPPPPPPLVSSSVSISAPHS